MITIKSIRYFILASLIITLPTHPMSWFNSTWKKVGIGVAAIAAHAISENNPEKLEHLITRPNSLVSLSLTHLIFHAAECNSDKAIAILLKHGVQVNAEIRMYNTVLMSPLAIATHYKSCDAIKILLERGAVLNPDRGRNVYYYAKDPQVIQLLNNHRFKKYTENKATMCQEIFDVTTRFSPDLIEIMAGYATQDPFHHTYAKEENSLEYEKQLLNEFPLFPLKSSQLHEQQVKEFVAAAPYRNPLSLDENA